MRPCTLIILLSLLPIHAPAQDTLSYRSDVYGNRYEWNPSGLRKISPDGRMLHAWQNPPGGNISWVDPADPFRILVFSRSTSQVIWLNNKLAPLTPAVYLPDTGILTPIAVCAAKDGGLWILDAAQSSLIKTDARLAVVSKTPFRLGYSASRDPEYKMTEFREGLFILESGMQLWQTDLFGQILKKTATPAIHLETGEDGLLLQLDSGKQVLYSK